MSVTTNARINQGDLDTAIPAGTNYTWTGGDLTSTSPKTITPVGFDDATLQAAINTAAAEFVDLTANRSSLLQAARTAHNNNVSYLAIPTPTQSQAVSQVAALTRQVNALIRFLVGDFTGTN